MTKDEPCPADGRPCEVISLVSEYLDEIPEETSIWECLPCTRCRVGLKAIYGLKGTRLGRHERRILLESPDSEAHPKRIAPESDTRASYEALNRARRKLEGAGLVDVTKDTPIRVRLTPASQALRTVLGEDLEEGKPIRWTPERLESIAESLGSQESDYLFLYFIETLKDKAERWGKQLDLVSRVDPELGERFSQLKHAADTVLGTIEARQRDRWNEAQAWIEARKAQTENVLPAATPRPALSAPEKVDPASSTPLREGSDETP